MDARGEGNAYDRGLKRQRGVGGGDGRVAKDQVKIRENGEEQKSCCEDDEDFDEPEHVRCALPERLCGLDESIESESIEA